MRAASRALSASGRSRVRVRTWSTCSLRRGAGPAIDASPCTPPGRRPGARTAGGRWAGRRTPSAPSRSRAEGPRTHGRRAAGPPRRAARGRAGPPAPACRAVRRVRFAGQSCTLAPRAAGCAPRPDPCRSPSCAGGESPEILVDPAGAVRPRAQVLARRDRELLRRDAPLVQVLGVDQDVEAGALRG